MISCGPDYFARHPVALSNPVLVSVSAVPFDAVAVTNWELIRLKSASIPRLGRLATNGDHPG